MYSYCELIFVVILGLVQINDAKPERDPCSRLYGHRGLMCCKDLPTLPMSADVKECLKQFPPPKGGMGPPHWDGEKPHHRDGDKPRHPPPCDIDKCVGLRQGYISESGEFLKDGLQSALDRQFQDLPQIKKDIEEHCIKGDINAYAPDDFCDGIKIKHCVHAQFLKACTSWSTEGKCSEVQKSIEECSSRSNGTNSGRDPCTRLYGHRGLMCCKDLPTLPMSADVKECLKEFPPPKGGMRPPHWDGDKPHHRDGDKPHQPPPCDVDKCVGLRQGYISEAGEFLKDGLQSALDRQFQDLPQIKKDIEEHCIKGDINTYAPEDFCDGIKIKHCVHAQFLKACTNWSTEGRCSEVQKTMEECRSRV